MSNSLLFRQFLLVCLSLMSTLVASFSGVLPAWVGVIVGGGLGWNVCLFCLMTEEVNR